MTSDAKVGLLLGLIFIFVIAFIINGLPNLRGETSTPDIPKEMTEFADDSLGIAARERQAYETLNWQELLARGNFALEQFDPPGPEAQAGGVRFTMPLPQVGPAVGGRFDTVETDEGQATVGLPERIAAKEVLEQMQTPGGEPGKIEGPAKDARPKVYVVVSGDTLAKIAQTFYGPEQGNKLANVTRIYTANKKQLASPDELSIGQKLLIPPLPLAAVKKAPQEVLSGSQFEVVPSVGTPRPGAAAPQAAGGRYYVVRDGDSLWKIAAARLGNGARYKEISKVNANLLANDDTLSIGMRLRLPPQ